MSDTWHQDSFGIPVSMNYAVADIYDKLLNEGWFSGRAKVAEPDLHWTRDQQDKSEHSQETSREQERGIDL